MSQRPARRSTRARLVPLALISLLGVAVLLRPGDDGGALLLANPDRARAEEMQAAFAALPEAPLVLVGLDADLGTYPEIRVAVRAALADLLARDAQLAVVSFTPEGRAIAGAELDRLGRDGVEADQLLDLGFIAGAEAGMVRAVTDLLPAGADGPVADAVREGDAGMAAFGLVLVVGGTELGPRTWVEQVGTRLPSLPIAAIVPTFAQPELAPYLRTGQLVALLATLRDGAAFAADVGAGGEGAPDRVPSALAMLLGMLVALGALGRSVAASLWGIAPGPEDSTGASVQGTSAGHGSETDADADAATDEPEADADASSAATPPDDPGTGPPAPSTEPEGDAR
jgi:hypothetical protein